MQLRKIMEDEELIKKCGLTELEMDTLEWLSTGAPLQNIANRSGVTRQAVHERAHKGIGKIVEQILTELERCKGK